MYFKGSCYAYNNELDTHAVAEAKCRDLGAHLPDIKSLAENELVFSFKGPTVDQLWLGYEYSIAERRFLSTFTGLTSAYTNWDENEPINGTVQRCVYMDNMELTNTSSKWKSDSCSSQRQSVCKIGKCQLLIAFVGAGRNQIFDQLYRCTRALDRFSVQAGPPPPLDLTFWSFLMFLHHGIARTLRGIFCEIS